MRVPSNASTVGVRRCLRSNKLTMSMRVRGSDDVFGGSRMVGRLFAGLVTVVLAACGTGEDQPKGDLGTSKMKLELPNTDIIQRVDYTVTMTFLETTPPTRTLRDELSSVFRNGELVAILPCTTGPDGDGLNQVDVAAKIYVRGRETPYEATGSGVFTCVRNADRPINIVLNVVQNLDGGFGDLDVMVGGTLCSSKTDPKDSGSYGVCGSGKCGDSEELLLFANTCEAVQAQRPTFWVCGDPADWEIRNISASEAAASGGNFDADRAAVAYAWFPVPQHNGSWRFGVIALDVFVMRTPDPTITTPDGTVKVWAGLSAAKALLERQNGMTLGRENVTYKYNFAAELTVAPRVEGQPAPELLMLLDQVQLGARVTWQRRFGPCEVPAAGVTLYPGLTAIDVRRDGNQAAFITFADADGFAASRARCETGWDETGDSPRPTITCGTPSPIIP